MKRVFLSVFTASLLSACVATDTPSSSSESSQSSSQAQSSSSTAPMSSSSIAVSSSSSVAASSSIAAQGSKFCPGDEPCRILPLGDSITVGNPDNNGGYRAPLFRLALQAGFDITFVGENPPDEQGGFFPVDNSPNGPATIEGVPFAPYHLGTSGITIQDLQQKIMDFNLLPFAAPNSEEPHIVLLHIGTNNMWNGGPNGTDARLRTLVDYLTSILPDALIVVSNIIPWPDQASNVNQYNGYIRPIVEAKQAAGYNVIFVDQFSNFPNGQLADTVHPTATGYAAMADAWFEAIDEYLVDID